MKTFLCRQLLDSQPALQSWVEVIERDLDRQFPFHEMFLSKDGHGYETFPSAHATCRLIHHVNDVGVYAYVHAGSVACLKC